jgi:hypothetical protein
VDYFVGNELENLLQTALGVSEFWASIIVYAVGTQIDWQQLCSTDPPPMPSFTVQDIAAILFSPFDDTLLPWQKLSDLVLNAAWWYGCECTTVITPPHPPLPAIPTGAPTPTGAGPGGVAGPCSDVEQTASSEGMGLDNQTYTDFSTLWLPGTPATGLVVVGSPELTTGLVMPPGVTQIVVSGQTLQSWSGSINERLGIWIWDSTKTVLQTFTIWQATSGSFSHTFTVGAGAAYYALYWLADAPGNPLVSTQMRVVLVCSGGGGIEAPCCPPDPSLIAQLQLIFNLVNSIYQGQPRQLHSYSQGAQHTGLTGNGSFALASSTIACLVELTTIPPAIGFEQSNPIYYFDVGWVTPLAAGFPYSPQKLTYQSQYMLFPTLTDEVAYTLLNGVHATIIELSRGP